MATYNLQVHLDGLHTSYFFKFVENISFLRGVTFYKKKAFRHLLRARQLCWLTGLYSAPAQLWRALGDEASMLYLATGLTILLPPDSGTQGRFVFLITLCCCCSCGRFMFFLSLSLSPKWENTGCLEGISRSPTIHIYYHAL